MVFMSDFYGGFEAIGGKARRDDGEIFHAIRRQLADHVAGVGHDPFRRPEARAAAGYRAATVAHDRCGAGIAQPLRPPRPALAQAW